MSNPSELPRGNVRSIYLLSITFSPASVANATSAEQTFTVTGVALGDYITINKPSSQAGLGIVGSRASAANTIGITFMNATAATITPTASEIYTVKVEKVTNKTASNTSPLSQLG